jgi:hypothetical protein
MNCKKVLIVGLSLAGALLLASAANAQTVLLGAGSSAQFATAAIGAITPDPVTSTAAPCGATPHFWSGKDGTNGAVIKGVDPRATGSPLNPPLEPGNIFVCWDQEPSPNTIIAYVTVDSVVGLRLYFAQGTGGDNNGVAGNGTLHFTTGSAASNLIAGFTDTDATVPADVASHLDSTGAAPGAAHHFNVAFTDIRPEDGVFANSRASASVGSGGFGYNPTNLVCGPNAVLSSFTATNGQVCIFNVTGTDPISGAAIPAYQTLTLGAAPIVIFANNNGNMGAGGCTFPTNILSKTATKLFSGQIGSSQSAFGPSVCNAVLSVMQREVTSGTYNTFESQLVHSRDGASSDTQEINGGNMNPIVGNPPSGTCFTPPVAFPASQTCTNPMNLSSGLNSVRYRAVGTGEMVKAVNGGTGVAAPPNPDRIGYAFYSLGSFYSSANANVRYFTLQGVDALYANYDTGGAFGTCTGQVQAGTFTCTTKLPSMVNVANGNYRVWSNYRWATAVPAPAIVTSLLTAAADQAHFAITNPGVNGGGQTCSGCVIKAIADFVPPQDLKVFRSHYGVGGKLPNNGTSGPSAYCAADQAAPNCIEEGGDMAGVAFFKVTDVNYFNLTGSEFVTQIE